MARLTRILVSLLPVKEYRTEDVQSIEKAIQSLPPSELAKFRRWFAEFDAIAWGAQLEADVAAGKLDLIAAEAIAEHQAGNAREI